MPAMPWTRILLLGVALALPSAGRSRAAADGQDPIVRLDTGALRGSTEGDVRSFLGIPYAAPPVGAARWAPPRRPSRWNGLRDARAFGAQCPQGAPGKPGVISGNENCLFLNVYVPTARSTSLRPVLVFVHGGAFVSGSGADIDGSRLATLGDIIVVTINYRLGALGFASLVALDFEQGSGQAGNYGIQDQVAALQWVRRNIGAFGGDPASVTLGGQSAGSISTWLQMASPEASSLFTRAMPMSGGFLTSPIFDRPPRWAAAGDVAQRTVATERQTGPSSKVLSALGCDESRAVAACLRAKPVAAIVNVAGPARLAQWWPVVDGRYVLDVDRAFTRPSRPGKPILAGFTRDEGDFFIQARLMSGAPMRNDADLGAYLAGVSGKASRLRAYAPHSYASAEQAIGAVIGDRFSCSALASMRHMAGRMPVFGYIFSDSDAPDTPFDTPGFKPGAAHTADIPYVFRAAYPAPLARPPHFDPDQNALSKRMAAYWASFVRTGVPNGDWQDMGQGDRLLELSPHGDRMIVASGVSDRMQCDLWSAVDKTD